MLVPMQLWGHGAVAEAAGQRGGAVGGHAAYIILQHWFCLRAWR